MRAGEPPGEPPRKIAAPPVAEAADRLRKVLKRAAGRRRRRRWWWPILLFLFGHFPPEGCSLGRPPPPRPGDKLLRAAHPHFIIYLQEPATSSRPTDRPRRLLEGAQLSVWREDSLVSWQISLAHAERGASFSIPGEKVSASARCLCRSADTIQFRLLPFGDLRAVPFAVCSAARQTRWIVFG